MITAKQIRAARALLEWSQDDLSKVASVSKAAIKNIETSLTSPRLKTITDLQSALEEAGIEFTSGNGVRIRDATLHVWQGPDAQAQLAEDIYRTLRDQGGEVLIAGVEDGARLSLAEIDVVRTHIRRLIKSGIRERVLLKEGDDRFIAPWFWHRWIKPKYFNPFPIKLYGSKLAMVTRKPADKIIVIDNPHYAESYRRLFNFVWDRATVPPEPTDTMRISEESRSGTEG